jgi:hypothetical protein
VGGSGGSGAQQNNVAGPMLLSIMQVSVEGLQMGGSTVLVDADSSPSVVDAASDTGFRPD